jgi:hypothetical protein
MSAHPKEIEARAKKVARFVKAIDILVLAIVEMMNDGFWVWLAKHTGKAEENPPSEKTMADILGVLRKRAGIVDAQPHRTVCPVCELPISGLEECPQCADHADEYLREREAIARAEAAQ